MPDQPLRARFTSVCPVCNEDITPGMAITLERSPTARHWGCYYPDVQPETPPDPPSKWEQYRGKTVTVATAFGQVTGTIIRSGGQFDRDGTPLPTRWLLKSQHLNDIGHTYRQTLILRESNSVIAELDGL